MHSIHAAFLSRCSVILASPISWGCPWLLGFIVTASSSGHLLRESQPAIHCLPLHVFEIMVQDSMTLLAYALHAALRLFELLSVTKKKWWYNPSCEERLMAGLQTAGHTAFPLRKQRNEYWRSAYFPFLFKPSNGTPNSYGESFHFN